MKAYLKYLYRYWFWALSRAFCFVWLRPKFNLKLLDRDQKMPKRPFIMVANHGTFFDPWLVGHLTPYPVSIMMNEEGFKASKFVQWYLRNVGAFPKKKGESDIKAMRLTLEALKGGYPVLIFPEGQTTWDGETQPIFGGIENLIKRAKLPLVMFNISGNFISRPWWGETFRDGEVRISRRILSPADLERMSRDELRDAIIRYIHNNDLKSEANRAVKFVGPPSLPGLDRFVWMCPTCLKEDQLSTDESAISCGACGSRWKMDVHFRLTPASDDAVAIGDLHDWSVWHKSQVQERIAKAGPDDLLTTGIGVHHCTVTELGEYPSISTGTLTLTRTRLTYVPDGGGEKTELLVSDINDYVFQRKTIFECRAKGEMYKFRFEPGSPMKWVYYLRYLNNWAECEKRGWI